ncbi:MAG TPA: DUF3262 family protein [Anaerolineae bacterium]|nr:DUF3262 family protein [Anaerolineae bacterium]
MGAFDAGSGLNAAGLRVAFIAIILAVALGWLGWVLVRTTKLTTKGRLSESVLFMSVFQALAVVAILAALIFVM